MKKRKSKEGKAKGNKDKSKNLMGFNFKMN